MSMQHPRNLAEWQKAVERSIRAGTNGVQIAIAHASDEAQVVRDEVDSYKILQPTAPIELNAQTSTYIDVNGKRRGRVILDFPDVTLSTTAQPLTVSFYELAAQDQSINPLPPFQSVATSEASSLSAGDFTPGSVWKFKARALSGNFVTPGQWSAEIQVTMLSDTTPPPAPSTPVVSVNLGTLKVAWDGLGAGSVVMPADFARIEVAFGLASSPTTVIDSMFTAGFITVGKSSYNVAHYFRFRAIDSSGNISPWSAQGLGIPVPLVDADIIQSHIDAAVTQITNIDTAAIKDGAILSAKLADNAVTQAKLADLAVSLAKLDTTANDKITKGINDAAAAQGTANTANTAAGTAQSAADAAQAKATAAADAAISNVAYSLNPSFEDWTGTLPTQHLLFGTGAPIKETTIVKRGVTSVRFNCTDTTTDRGLNWNGILNHAPNMEYFTVELSFYLASGTTLSGAGVLIDWIGMTNNRAVLNLSTEITAPQTGKWYSIIKTLRRPTNATGTWTSMDGFLVANYSTGLSAKAVKDIVFDWMNIRPATAEEITSYGAPSLITTAQDAANAAQATADTAFANAGTALTNAGLAQTSADSKNSVYYTATAPAGTGFKVNDTWFRSSDNQINRWSGSAWVAIPDSAIAAADAKAVAAQTSADGKTTTYYGTTAPAGSGYKVNDIWYKSPSNQINRWSGSAWVATADTAIAAAQTAADSAATAASTADGKAVTAQTAANNAQTSANSAATAASAAQTTADGKGKVYSGTSAPSPALTQDLWFDTTGGGNTPKKYIGGVWTSLTDKVASDAAASAASASSAAATADSKAVTAQTAANTAQTAANTAQTSANNASTLANAIVKTSTSAATGTPPSVGALWNQTNSAGDLIINTWTANAAGTAWVLRKLDDAVIGNLNAATINAGIINAARLQATDIRTLFLTAGKVTAADIVTGTLTSASGVFGTMDASVINAGTLNAARIAAGSITVGKLTVTDLSNFAPSFAESPGDWTLTGGMAIVASTLDTTGSRVDSNGTVTGTQWARGPLMAVKPGETLYATATVYRSSGATGGVFLRYEWFDGSEVALTSPAYTGSSQSNASASGTKLELTTVVPAGAAYARFTLPATATAGNLGFYSVWGRRMNGAEMIVDGAITTSKITTDAIIAGHISTGAITATKLAVDSVTATAIKAGEITAAKLVTGTLTSASGVFGVIDASIINAGTINSARLVAADIRTLFLQAGKIAAVDIVTGALTSASGVFGTVDASVLTAGTINAARYNATDIRTKFLAAGLVTAADMVTGTITAASGIIGSLDIGTVTTGQLSGSFITAKTLTADKLIVSSGANLHPDPQVEDPTGWGAATGVTVDPANGRSGKGSILIATGSTQNGIYYAQTATLNPRRSRIVAGGTYRLGAWVFTSADAPAGSLQLYGRVYADTGTSNTTLANLPGQEPYNRTTVLANTWTWVEGMVSVPASSAYLNLVPGVFKQTTFTTGTVRFSDMSIQQAIAGELVVDGSVTATKVAADAITARNIVVGDFANIAIGSDFEDPAAVPWTLAAPHTISTAQKKFGTSSLRLGLDPAVQKSYFTNDLRVKEGEQWYFKLYAYIDATFNGTGNSKLRIGDQANVVLATITYNAITRSTWVPLEVVVTVPAGVTSLQVEMWSDNTAGYGYIDDIQMRRMSEASLIQNLGVEKLTASTASMGQAVIDKLWTDVVRSKKITTDMLVVAGENMIANGFGENGDNTNWNLWTFDASDKPTGTLGSFTQNTTVTRYLANQQPVMPVEEDTYYVLEGWIKASVANSRVFVESMETGGTDPNPKYILDNYIVPTVWTRFSVPVKTSVGQTAMQFRMFANHVNGSVTNATQKLAGLRFRKQITTNLIVSGGIVASHLSLTEDLWTPVLGAHKITAVELNVNDVTADTGVIGNLRTNLLTTDWIKAVNIDATQGITSRHTITGATIQTSATALRGIKVSSTGILAYNSTGVNTFSLDGTTGNVVATGTMQTSPSGSRVVVWDRADGTAAVDMYTDTSGHHGSLYTQPQVGNGLYVTNLMHYSASPITTTNWTARVTLFEDETWAIGQRTKLCAITGDAAGLLHFQGKFSYNYSPVDETFVVGNTVSSNFTSGSFTYTYGAPVSSGVRRVIASADAGAVVQSATYSQTASTFSWWYSTVANASVSARFWAVWTA